MQRQNLPLFHNKRGQALKPDPFCCSFQNKLLIWYKTHARDLPWRRTKDPYSIWVSEIMLQQTQVATVVPYYEKWIRRFPTLKSLAEVSLPEILRYWVGLGYYRRARSIHKTARMLLKNAGAGSPLQFPDSADELMKLPGVGRYTAGAIASIAFGEKVPVLDGNVIRILSRLLALKDFVDSPKTIQKLWKISESLLPEKNTGDFNQAMMELGATVCFPEDPQCGVCPAASFCKAHQMGRETNFPLKKRAESAIKKETAALILRRNGKVLVRRQPKEGRWGGLWMFPYWDDPRTMRRTLGTAGKALKHKLTVRHGFTKYSVRLKVYEMKGAGYRVSGKTKGVRPQKSRGLTHSAFPNPRDLEQRWVRPRDLDQLAFPSPHQKIVKELVRENGR